MNTIKLKIKINSQSHKLTKSLLNYTVRNPPTKNKVVETNIPK